MNTVLQPAAQVVSKHSKGKLSLAQRADAIRALGRQIIADVIEIGHHLQAVKNLTGHGNFSHWIRSEFGWDIRTAQRYMQVADFAGKNDNVTLLNLPLSAVYTLASPSTPKVAVEEVIERAASGEVVSLKEIRALVPRRGGSNAPSRKTSPDPHAGDIVADALAQVMRMSPRQRMDFAARLPSLINMRDVTPISASVSAVPGGTTGAPTTIGSTPTPATVNVSTASTIYTPEELEERKERTEALLADVDHRGIPNFLVRQST